MPDAFNKPIEDLALLGDMRTAALLDSAGTFVWFCTPRFDSPAVMANLLGHAGNGFWLLAAEGWAEREYVADTMVLQTTWHTSTGVAKVYDFMPPGADTPHLCRVIEGVDGIVEFASVLKPRMDYGRSMPWVRTSGTLTQLVAGPDALWLHGPVRARGVDESTVTTCQVKAGQRVAFTLGWQPSHVYQYIPYDAIGGLVATVDFWRTWARGCSYQGVQRDAVVRSLLTLKALAYAPTGGIVAAPTTSLPEWLGGERNWDYRYCWLRDASLTLQSLMGSGFVEEAWAWCEWLVRAVAGRPADLQTMYTIDGARRMVESTVPHLAGYGNSSPVRVGNAAAEQFQLDVYGEVIECLNLAKRLGLPQMAGVDDLLRMLLRFLGASWHRPDEGIWEVRGPRRHFVHSKVSAWMAFDSSIRAVEMGLLTGPVGQWRRTASTIHAAVCRAGYDPGLNSFVAAYDMPKLDAALLLLPKMGFLPPTDPRIIGTVTAIERDLMPQGLVMRYMPSPEYDGLEGAEGAFLMCSFWMVEALHAIGRKAQAFELFERLLGLRNDLGLLAEEYDPVRRRQVGNFPQAFSHLQLVAAAAALQDETPATLVA